MSKNSFDLKQIEDILFKKKYKLSEVQDKIEKVAFDIVRFKDNDKAADLWQVQQADDGEYIVALYEEKVPVKTASKNPWEVIASSTFQTLSFFYKGDPIIKIAANRLGIPKEELSMVEKYLPKKLAENENLVKSLLKEMPEITKKEVLNKYPELM